MFGLISKYRKEIEAVCSVIVFTLTKVVVLIQEVAVFATAAFGGTVFSA